MIEEQCMHACVCVMLTCYSGPGGGRVMRMRGQVSVKRCRESHKFVKSKSGNHECLYSECFVSSEKSNSNLFNFGVEVDSDLFQICTDRCTYAGTHLFRFMYDCSVVTRCMRCKPSISRYNVCEP